MAEAIQNFEALPKCSDFLTPEFKSQENTSPASPTCHVNRPFSSPFSDQIPNSI
jgi:hypothetical protein